MHETTSGSQEIAEGSRSLIRDILTCKSVPFQLRTSADRTQLMGIWQEPNNVVLL